MQTHQAALTALGSGDYAGAERILRRLLHANGEDSLALHVMGIVMMQTDRHRQGLSFFARAERAGDRSSQLRSNRASCFASLGEHEEALRELDLALSLAPSDAVLHYNRGNALMNLQRHAEALAAFDTALAINPGIGEAWQNRTRVLTRLHRPEEAMESFDRALAILPPNPDLFANRSGTLDFLNRREEALRDVNFALKLDPEHSLAHWNAAMVCLALGDLERGFREYEYRYAANNHVWLDPGVVQKRPRYPQPLWLGKEDINGKGLLIVHEQGLGDALQFCRYGKLAAARGARVIFATMAPLVEILKSLDFPVQIVGPNERLPKFDYHIPLMSLPLAFGTTLETVPADVPYLHALPQKIEKFSELLTGDGLKVGIAWSGNPQLQNNAVRSASLEELAPIFATPGVRFFAVQKGIAKAEREAAQAYGIIDYSDMIEDFSDTAGLMAGLDVVISVDSAPAHLAGALGVPVWLLLFHAAEWRWLMGREDSPWYPSARLFRQAVPRDWREVASRVHAELTKLADKTA